MTILGFDHIALTVSDIPAALAFYVDLLGLRPADDRNPQTASYFWVSCGPAQSINLVRNPQATPGARGEQVTPDLTPHLALTCPLGDLDALHEKLQQAGVEVLLRSETGVYFCDPDGNFLEVTGWRESWARRAGVGHW